MKSALSYPVFVLFFSFLVFALILTVILPSFAALFDALDIPLPAVTRAALALGLFLQEKGFYFLVELLLGAVGGVVWLRSERGKRSTDAFLFRFPFIRRLYLIRVTLALSALLKSGKTLSDALADIADITDNGAVKEELLKIKKDIERGGDFAQSMERSFGDTALARMIHVGMESGRLPLFLERSAHLMTEETKIGNLDGFDANDLVAPEDMLELDRWAITKLNQLIEKVADAYNDYEFHVVSHAINDFCVVELSSFYLDIIKDRLYCEGKNSLKRRSAQTALYLILDSMAKMFAPILAFTCDEIWQAMPHREGDDERNIVLNEMNEPFTQYALSDEALARWDKLIALRDDVNGVLESARASKRIGKPLEASVRLHAKDEASRELLDEVGSMNLSELFIVSQCLIKDEDSEEAEAVSGAGSNNPGLNISVIEAPGVKCPRCWMHSLNAQPETGLCPRCAAVIAGE